LLDKVALEQGFSSSTLLLPSISFRQFSQTRFNLHVAPTRRTNGRSLGTFRKAMLFRKFGNIRAGQYCDTVWRSACYSQMPAICWWHKVYFICTQSTWNDVKLKVQAGTAANVNTRYLTARAHW
jgi:hypothetical protein